MTLDEAKLLVRQQAYEGTICPCCDRYLKIYTRKLNSAMAAGLLAFYRYASQKGITQFYHLRDVAERSAGFAKWCGHGGDFPKLRFWGLIERRGKEPDEDKHDSGFWRITEEGIAFVLKKADVPRKIMLYKNRRVDNSLERVTIDQCLKDPFSWHELMQETPTPQLSMFAS